MGATRRLMANLISIVVPTFNESGNISPLVHRIDSALSGRKYEILFVDDDSPDGTSEMVESLSGEFPVRVFVRKGRRGLASAVAEGFSHIAGDIITVMDADMQHPPEAIPELIREIENGADIAVASRYVPGGKVPGLNLLRKLISRGATLIAHLLLPASRKITDPMSGFFACKRGVIAEAKLNPIGFKILLEVLTLGAYQSVAQVPITFGARDQGQSKLSVGQQIEYLKHIVSLMKRSGELLRFLKFCLVGFSGVGVNLGMLWLLTEKAGLFYILSAAIGIEISIISNFILNNFFTFTDRRRHGIGEFFRHLLRFNAVSLVGVGINLGTLWLLTSVAGLYYLLSNCVGITLATLWNYLVNNWWTWEWTAKAGHRKGSTSKRGKRISTTPRTVLFFYSVPILLLASALSGIGFELSNTFYLVAGTVVWIVWFFLLFQIAIPSTDQKLKKHFGWLKKGALVIFIVLFTVGVAEAVFLPAFSSGLISTEKWSKDTKEVIDGFQDAFAYNDATALTHQAVDNLLEGLNPYYHPNLITANIAFNSSYDKVTPLRVGRFADIFPYPSPDDLKTVWKDALENPEVPPPELESMLNYPSGSFLLPAPIAALGIGDLRIIYAIFIAMAVFVVVWQMRMQWRLLFLGALVICFEITNSVASGETGSMTFALLLVAWVLLPRKLWISVIVMGVAVATKQTAWFYLPFYLIYIFMNEKRWKILPVIGIMIATFLAMNLPFLISDPKFWIRSVLAPMTDPMFPIGVGTITFVTGGLIDIRSSLPFAIIELLVMIGSIVWYFRNCRRYPNTGPILAVLPLFFAWRSLWPYFFYANILVLAGILVNEYGHKNRSATQPAP